MQHVLAGSSLPQTGDMAQQFSAPYRDYKMTHELCIVYSIPCVSHPLLHAVPPSHHSKNLLNVIILLKKLLYFLATRSMIEEMNCLLVAILILQLSVLFQSTYIIILLCSMTISAAISSSIQSAMPCMHYMYMQSCCEYNTLGELPQYIVILLL